MITLYGINSENGLTTKDIIPVKFFTYSGGEEFVRIETDLKSKQYNKLVIKSITKCSVDIMRTVLLVNAVNNMFIFSEEEIEAYKNEEIVIPSLELILPYVPYARQDRVCHSGEPFSLNVMVSILSNLLIDKLYVYDPHSKVFLDLLYSYDYCTTFTTESISQYQLFSSTREYLDKIYDKNTILISPDKGATEKTKELGNWYSLDVVQAEKVRDPKDGSITGTVVHCDKGYLNDKIVMINDDICDGGRTFIEIAKAIKADHKPKEINLAVTHGIFSKGFEPLNDFDNIFAGFYLGHLKQEQLPSNFFIANHEIRGC